MTPYSRKRTGKRRFACFTTKKIIKSIRELRTIPLFYWGPISFILFGLISFGIGYLPAESKGSGGVSLAVNGQKKIEYVSDANLFLNANTGRGWLNDSGFLVMGNSSLVASSPTLNATPKTLGLWMSEGDFGSRQDIVEYIVSKGDTLDSIAERFDISVNTIVWANDLKGKSVKTGQKLLILPVSGVMHVVQSGDTVSKIAKKYKADEDKILAFNYLSLGESLIEGEVLIVPDGQIINQAPRNFAKSGSALSTNNYNGQSHVFPYGQCTWWVAQKRAIPHPSLGNAKQWIKNAASRGWSVCVGSSCAPKAGAVVQLTGNSVYGHVAYVEEVRGDRIVVSEMNYIGWGKINYRTIPIGSYQIKGYIY